MRTPLALVLLVLIGGPAAAQMAKPRSVADCEQVKGDLAYNQCLSMFGPAAHTKSGIGAGSGDGPVTAAAAVPAQEVAEPPRRGRRGRSVRRGGRQGASFTVGQRGGGHHGGRRHRRR